MDLTNLNNRQKKKNNSFELSTIAFGKIPPQAKDLEEAVLGAILIEKNAFEVISEILPKDAFYVEAHQRIFSAMISLAKKNQPIDTLTLMEELRFREELDLIGGPFYLVQLTNKVFSSANIETHSRILLQKFLQREIIRIGSEMVSVAYEDSTDVFELIDQVETSVFDITQSYLKSDYKHISQGVIEVVNRIEHLKDSDQNITGITSGFKEVDKITLGWQNNNLIILAARPSVGKTAFALNLARNAALNPAKPTPVGFFSLEMSLSQLTQRLLSSESKVWLKSIKRGKMDESESETLYMKGVRKINEAPIYVDDTGALNMFELKAKARRMVNKHKVGLIIIDYLQLMSGDGKRNSNREQEISQISRDLKKLAKALDVPIIALSQLSREIEKRSNPIPKLSDLRESGAIEQDADLVMFLYRPSEEDQKKDADLANTGNLSISKHRDGELGDIVFKVNDTIQVWKDIAGTSYGNLIPLSEANQTENLF